MFGIYLFQLSPIIWRGILKGSMTLVMDKPLYIGVGLMFVSSISLFFCGLLVEFLRSKLFRVLKIEQLSRKIVDFMMKMSGKYIARLEKK